MLDEHFGRNGGDEATENFEKEVSEVGLAVCEDSQSLHKMIEKTDKLLPHHQISYKTDRGLVGVTQERKEDMPQLERNVAERKLKKIIKYKSLESHNPSI